MDDTASLTVTLPDAEVDDALLPDPLRLLVMGHFVYAGRVGGAEHMFYNLMHGLSRSCRTLTLLCASEQNLDATFLREFREHATTEIIERGGGGPRFIAEQRACLAANSESDAVLFPNYYVPPVVPRRLGRIVTVLHDLQYKHFPQYFSAKKRAWLTASQAFAVRRADRVITISEFVRQDTLRRFGEALADKVTVVPNPVSWARFAPSEGQSRPIPQPYVLSVAAQYPHKNLDVLVRAFAAASQRVPDLKLVLCGQDYRSLHGVAGSRAGLLPLAEELGIAGRVQLTGYVDDAALGRWYRHAEMFAFPSVFEGFGMPAVEALGFDLPTLTTRRTAIPETTLGLAQYVEDPSDAGEWAERIVAMARDPGRHRPGEAGAARVRSRYAPDRIARAYARACAA